MIGEKIVGQDSRAVAQVVRTAANSVDYVKLNTNNFTVGELVEFKESSRSAIIQEVNPEVMLTKLKLQIRQRSSSSILRLF